MPRSARSPEENKSSEVRVRVEQELKNDLDAIRLNRKESEAVIVREALRQYVERYKAEAEAETTPREGN